MCNFQELSLKGKRCPSPPSLFLLARMHIEWSELEQLFVPQIGRLMVRLTARS